MKSPESKEWGKGWVKARSYDDFMQIKKICSFGGHSPMSEHTAGLVELGMEEILGIENMYGLKETQKTIGVGSLIQAITLEMQEVIYII